MESSITDLNQWLGQFVQIVAYGTSYVGILQKIDFDEGSLVLADGEDTVKIDLEQITDINHVDIANHHY